MAIAARPRGLRHEQVVDTSRKRFGLEVGASRISSRRGARDRRSGHRIERNGNAVLYRTSPHVEAQLQRDIEVAFTAMVLFVFLVAGCGGGTSTAATSSANVAPPTVVLESATPVPAPSPTPDYSQAANWLALPSAPTKPVDVFFLYPSEYFAVNAGDPLICAIDNPMMMNGAQQKLRLLASALEPCGNIYAPYYQQADAIQVLSMPVAQRDVVEGGIPTTDALAAFDYFIEHHNNGRPFILFGHSQGSNVLINLMAAYMGAHPGVYNRMVAAYVPGYSVTPQYLAQNPELKFAEGADDTGVIISYNTVAPVVNGPDPVVLPGAMVINPITWTRTETLATADQNLGSVEVSANGSFVFDSQGNPVCVKNFADAQVNLARGELICSTGNVEQLAPLDNGLPLGVFHNLDIPFYYMNLRANAANRIDRFLNRR